MNIFIFCFFLFFRFSLVLHEANDHSNLKSWNCSHCYFVFKNSIDLAKHIAFEHHYGTMNTSLNILFLCKLIFYVLFLGQFGCTKEQCNYQSETRSKVCKHWHSRQHNQNKAIEPCSMSNDDVNNEKRTFAKSNEEQRISDVGKRSQFSSFSSNASKDKPSSFKKNKSKSSAIKIIKKYEIISVKCHVEECDEIFETNHKLHQHLALHHNKLPFVCYLVPGCGESFQTRYGPNMHLI